MAVRGDACPAHARAPARGWPPPAGALPGGGLALPALRTAVSLLALLGIATGADGAQGIYQPVAADRPYQRRLLQESAALGERLAGQARCVESGELAAWLRALGTELAPAPSDDYIEYRFHLLRDGSPNAFALADGQIYVHTGALAWLESEAQVSALLAHEIAHVAGHHPFLGARATNRRERASTVVSGLLEPGGFLIPNLADLGQRTLTRLSLAWYAKDLEREADQFALALLREEARDTGALLSLFTRLRDAARVQQLHQPILGAAHPGLQERLRALRNAGAGRDARSPSAGERQAYARRVEQLVVDTVHEHIRTERFAAAVELATSLTERLPRSAIAHAAAGDAWSALGPLADWTALAGNEDARPRREVQRKTRDERWREALQSPAGTVRLARHLAEADTHYRRAVALDPTLADACRGMARLAERRAQPDATAAAYGSYLALAPPGGPAACLVDEQLADFDGEATTARERGPRGGGVWVILPPAAEVTIQRVGADALRPEAATRLGQEVATTIRSTLAGAGYDVRELTMKTLQQDPQLLQAYLALRQRWAAVGPQVERRPGKVEQGRYRLGEDARRLARAVGADKLLLPALQIDAAAHGQIAKAILISTITFLLRGRAGYAHLDIGIVDGSTGRVDAYQQANVRLVGAGVLDEPGAIAAPMTRTALERLPPAPSGGR